MTNVSMDQTTAVKFILKSFSRGGSRIYCTLAAARPGTGDELSPSSAAGAYRGDSWAR
ncbi:MAG: hypothetical protein QOI33_2995 [Mycobacterium sp.]|jgi:hypothetical protein|nr:hypothetical protein [Mycobacterium sp.]